MFLYKTKGNTSPQGKRRVFFTCHPEDHYKLFDRITDELLKYADCAIWYTMDPDYDDIARDLGQMNLLVVPVTAKLLTKPCRAMDTDVPFAIENHIPILPLMQEDGLIELFTRRFGDLQYLDPNARDETAISYEDKLKKYLDSVLIGDELAAKVRAAFDAYIFLSYRKKDRKYANELMRLIHKNDFCRDVAIWYDEFLTPGENFNQAISDALKKSELFAMVVTPNLVNEPNYVRTVEYPMAAELGKRILPAELIKTDPEALSAQYPAVPESVDAKDAPALSDALASALQRVARAENDADPLHNFFIGLAYLDGIDVEVDHGRALSLITLAAEDREGKVPEAIEKLVSMYTEGHGVARDYRAAAEWQRKLVEYWEEEYRKSYSMYDYAILFRVLWDLGDQFSNLGDPDEAEKAYRRMLELCEKHQWDNAYSAQAKHNLSVCYNKLGDICQARGDVNGAEEFYRKALALSERLADETGTVLARRDLSICYERVGNIREARGDVNGAEEFYRKGLTVRARLADETGTVEARLNLSISYEKLGDIRRARGDVNGAEVCYRKGLALKERLADETGTLEARRGLSISYDNLGIICQARGDVDGAEGFYRKGLTLRERLADETGTVEARRNLSISYDNLGNICRVRGDVDGAEEFYRKGLTVRERLADETGTVEARRDLSICYDRLGDICQARGDVGGAEEFYRKGLTLREQLADETGTVEARRGLSISYNKLGDIRQARGDLYAAEEFHRKALALSEQLADETGTVEARGDLSASYERLGVICQSRGDVNGAEEFYRKALALRERLAEEAGTVKAYDDLALSYYFLAVIHKPYDRNLLEKSLRIFTALAAQCPGVARYSQIRDMIKHTLEQMN